MRALTSVFPKEFDFAAPPFPVPEEALSALSRAALETRELADLDLQTLDIAQLIALRDGAVIAIAADAGAHLIDLGAGEALQVYRPAGDGHGAGDGASRVSADGETLWTARFGAEAINDDGDVYAPLIFEDVDLASGAISMKTAVQSLPPKGGGAAISPDGALFAVDIGPGHTDRTLVAVFSRARQALAGVATLPADSAQVEFLAPDRLLLTTNPPNIYGAAPGLYLWDLAEDRPRVLRAPGRAPLCPGASGASRRSVAAEIAAGRLPAADWAASETGAEVALLLPSLGGGSCILRWDAATGREVPPVFTRTTYRSLAFAVAGGPYAALPEDGDLTLVSAGAETPLAGCGGAARHFASGGQGLILCEGDRAATLHQGYSGRRSWRGPPLSSLTAAAYDPQGQRLIMARADGRLAVWDAAARGYPVVRGDAPMTLAQPDKDHVAVLIDGGASVVFDLSGDPATEIDPALLARIRPAEQSPLLALAATGPAAPEETCAPLIAANVIHRSDSPSGRRAAIETADGLAVYDRATCLPVMRMATRTAGSGPMLVSDDFLWAPTPGEVMVFPLSVPPAAALASLHSRAAAFRAK